MNKTQNPIRTKKISIPLVGIELWRGGKWAELFNEIRWHIIQIEVQLKASLEIGIIP